MPKKAKKIKDFEPCPHGLTEEHDCQGFIPVRELLGVADNYLTTACFLTGHLADGSSRRGLERVKRACQFMEKVRELMGVEE